MAFVSAMESGGIAAVLNHAGNNHVLLAGSDQGGATRLDIHWAGTPAIVLHADEQGGIIGNVS